MPCQCQCHARRAEPRQPAHTIAGTPLSTKGETRRGEARQKAERHCPAWSACTRDSSRSHQAPARWRWSLTIRVVGIVDPSSIIHCPLPAIDSSSCLRRDKSYYCTRRVGAGSSDGRRIANEEAGRRGAQRQRRHEKRQDGFVGLYIPRTARVPEGRGVGAKGLRRVMQTCVKRVRKWTALR